MRKVTVKPQAYEEKKCRKLMKRRQVTTETKKKLRILPFGK